MACGTGRGGGGVGGAEGMLPLLLNYTYIRASFIYITLFIYSPPNLSLQYLNQSLYFECIWRSGNESMSPVDM